MDLGVRLADRYSLEERVASGGMAEVWRAWDEVLARTVAIKLVGATGRRGMAFRRRFRDEARSAAGLTHPRVVTIHDYGETEDGFGSRTPYIVMEFLTGETLADRLTRGPLPAAEAVRVCGQVAEALAAAHRAGLVHRDVKPGNVFLTPDGVKVLDFGIARAMRGEPVFSAPFAWPAPWADDEPTEPLDMAPYLAPEEDGDHAVESSADVYALGVVLTEALTGTRDSAAAMPPGVPDRVAELCARCRATDPRDRPSALEVARTLAAGLATPEPDLPASSGSVRVSASGTDRDPAAGHAVESPDSADQTLSSDQPIPRQRSAVSEESRSSADDSSRDELAPSERSAEREWPGSSDLASSVERSAVSEEPPMSVDDSSHDEPVPSERSAERGHSGSSDPAASAGRSAEKSDSSAPSDSNTRSSRTGPPYPAEETEEMTSPLPDPVLRVEHVSVVPELQEEAAAGGRRARRPKTGMLAAGGLVLAATALLIEVFVLMGPPAERRGPDEARPAATAAEPSGSPSTAPPATSGGAGAGMAMDGAAKTDIGAGDGIATDDPPTRPRPEDTAAAPAGGTDSLPTSKASPRATSGGEPAAGQGPRTAADTIQSLGQLSSLLDQGFAAGEIRSDVVVDFNNLVTNLRNELIAGSDVELGVRVANLRSKIHTRLREGALSPRYAAVLNDSLPAATG